MIEPIRVEALARHHDRPDLSVPQETAMPHFWGTLSDEK